MKGISLRLRVTEAVTITSSVDRENTIDTYDHIPGTAIRGAIAGRYIQENGVDAAFPEAFLRGVRYRHALPLVDDERARAIPLSRFGCKYDATHPAADRAYEYLNPPGVATRPWLCPTCEAERERHPGWESTRRARIDPVIDSASRVELVGRLAREGRLFTTRRIAVGQDFVAEIWAPEPREILERAGVGVGDRIRVGRAKTTNGAIEIVDIDDAAPKQIPGSAGNEYLAIVAVLRTPAILRDRWLRPTRSFQIPTFEHPMEITTWSDWTTVFGWNAAAGLPRTPDVAITAGSTILFTPSIDQDATEAEAAMDSIVANGVGLRRVEGFGEVDLMALSDLGGNQS